MKRIVVLFFLLIPFLAGCNEAAEQQAQSETPAPAAETQSAASDLSQGFSGAVVEVMDADQYTYAKVATEQGEVWCAGPKTVLNEGDTVIASAGMVMKDFKSKSLDRTFEQLVFVEGLMVAGAEAPVEAPSSKMPAGHPPVASKNTDNIGGLPGLKEIPVAEIPELPKAEGGYTVAEVFAKKDELAGKEITIRGMVVKFNPQIMNVNWIHIQDGSGEKGTDDLTITTAETVEIGKVAVITGKLSVNKDFGYGYKYDAIVEDAKIVVE